MRTTSMNLQTLAASTRARHMSRLQILKREALLAKNTTLTTQKTAFFGQNLSSKNFFTSASAFLGQVNQRPMKTFEGSSRKSFSDEAASFGGMDDLYRGPVKRFVDGEKTLSKLLQVVALTRRESFLHRHLNVNSSQEFKNLFKDLYEKASIEERKKFEENMVGLLHKFVRDKEPALMVEDMLKAISPLPVDFMQKIYDEVADNQIGFVSAYFGPRLLGNVLDFGSPFRENLIDGYLVQLEAIKKTATVNPAEGKAVETFAPMLEDDVSLKIVVTNPMLFHPHETAALNNILGAAGNSKPPASMKKFPEWKVIPFSHLTVTTSSAYFNCNVLYKASLKNKFKLLDIVLTDYDKYHSWRKLDHQVDSETGKKHVYGSTSDGTTGQIEVRQISAPLIRAMVIAVKDLEAGGFAQDEEMEKKLKSFKVTTDKMSASVASEFGREEYLAKKEDGNRSRDHRGPRNRNKNEWTGGASSGGFSQFKFADYLKDRARE